ncbi:nucleic acid-binding, OB-fold protein [Artemisia annua]|uniref:Nucleic acid-binding, OB-fold protein n=1 Tax=Artemisia annua TaxID=35608 RepID=A0A2U1NGF2_ARTAN|nr:nucleic acid-binding, OB-fold protein [Artemisia annua]
MLEDIDVTETETKGDDNVWYCKKCMTKVTSVVLRLRLNVRVQDSTGTITLVLFDREDGDVDSFPKEISKLINKKFIFKIKVSDFNIEYGYDVYTVLKLCDDAEIMDALIKGDGTDKDVVSCAGDSLAATDIDNNSDTSPATKRSRDTSDKELLGQNSSTKRKLVPVKIEKP